MAFVLPPPSLVSHFLRIYKGQSKIERCSLIFLCQIWLLFFLLLFFYSFLKLIFFSISFFDIGLVRNYDSWFFYGLIMGHRFERLISLTLGFFTLFFSFNFIFQHCVYWKLDFMIFFAFFSIGLSQSHDLNRGFD
jgi:hypothetical protein